MPALIRYQCYVLRKTVTVFAFGVTFYIFITGFASDFDVFFLDWPLASSGIVIAVYIIIVSMVRIHSMSISIMMMI